MFLKRMTILFSVTFLLFAGVFLSLIVSDLISVSQMVEFVETVYVNSNAQFVLTIVAGIILVLNFLLYRLFSINYHRDKVIAFDNPSGRISVSLSALEDLVKRVIANNPDTKEVKTDIFATRKGLSIKLKVNVKTETSIPAITSVLQTEVTKKIQTTIGMEEPIDIAIYVSKIIPDQNREKKVKEKVKKKEAEPVVPFQGYRA